MEAQRGKGGGLRLARDATAITVGDVLQMVDPKSMVLNPCLNGHADCPRAELCTVRPRLRGVQEQLGDSLHSLTFDQFAVSPGAPSSM